jgi:hypothetical protein
VSKVYEVSEKDLMRKFRAIEEKRHPAVVRGIMSAVLLGAEIVARAEPKDLGTLKQSTRGVPTSSGGYILVDAPHAGAVELGTRPHWVPLKPLIAWARRHGAADDAAAFRMAKGIQMKIAKVGTAPRYFMRKSLPVLRRILAIEIDREWKAVDG